jgi:DNA-binding transcriptional regulator LsrR (DeoR family)
VDDATERLIARIARLYYVEDLPKTEIGRQFGLSRFRVARLLEQGRDEGIVTIEIRGAAAHLDQMAIDLSAHLKLDAVVVPGGGGEEMVRDRIAREAADRIRGLLSPGDTFGFSWGRTMLTVSEHLSDLPPSAVVQLTGTVGDDLSQSPVEILRNIAGESSVSAHPIFAPMYVASAENAAMLRAEPAIASTLARFADLRLVAMSVGSWNPPVTQLREYFSPADVATLDEVGAQAELLGIFLDPSGRVVAGELDQRRIAATVEDLLGVPDVIAAAGSKIKVPAIMAAARSGLVTTLITDDQAAVELMRLPAVDAPVHRRA